MKSGLALYSKVAHNNWSGVHYSGDLKLMPSTINGKLIYS